VIKPGLRWEIIFALLIAMVTASFLISIVVMSVTKRSIIDQKVEATATLIHAFQHSVDSICSGNEEALLNRTVVWQLQRLVLLFTKEKDLKTVFVTDRTGRILASNHVNRIGTTLKDDDLNKVISTAGILARLPQDKNDIFRQVSDELSVSAPLYLKGQVAGAIRMTFSLQSIHAAITNSLQLIVFYIIFTAILITALGSYLLSRIVVRPIQRLAQATEALGKGDFNVLVENTSRNELGHLSLAFSTMSNRIEQHQKELHAKIESLEILNRDLQQSRKEVLAGERLALVGKLAAGVAHEIGNPLSVILGYVGLLQKKEPQHSPSLDYLRRVEQELLRINHTIRGLLDFSRQPQSEAALVDMKQVLDDALGLVGHQGKFQELQLITSLEDELWLVEGDRNQFQQVILNLLLNAGEAVADRGTIALLADRMIWKDDTLVACAVAHRTDFSPVPLFGLGDERVPWEDPAPFVNGQPVLRLLTADDGIGIAEGNLGRIFDPFFTTKEAGKGTGLGLAICMRIIESSGGIITARSEIGRGSAFLILLPGKGLQNGYDSHSHRG